MSNPDTAAVVSAADWWTNPENLSLVACQIMADCETVEGARARVAEFLDRPWRWTAEFLQAKSAAAQAARSGA